MLIEYMTITCSYLPTVMHFALGSDPQAHQATGLKRSLSAEMEA